MFLPLRVVTISNDRKGPCCSGGGGVVSEDFLGERTPGPDGEVGDRGRAKQGSLIRKKRNVLKDYRSFAKTRMRGPVGPFTCLFVPSL